MDAGDTLGSTSETVEKISGLFEENLSVPEEGAEEDAGLEQDADADPEQAAEEQDTPAEEETQSGIKPATVRISDDEEITLEEAKNGYLRQRDYTKKTKALAEARKQFENDELPQLRSQKQQYAALLGKLEEAIKTASPGEPDWLAIRATLSPEEFTQRWAEWQDYSKKVETLATERTRAEKEAQQESIRHADQTAREAYEKLMELIPEWKDDKKGSAERENIVRYAETHGFTREDVASIGRPEMFMILRDAAAYAAIRSKVKDAPPAGKKLATPVLRPGSANQNTRSPKSEATRAVQKAAKTGRVEDAAEAMLKAGFLS